MRFCQVGAKMFHADRWMDRDMTLLFTVVQMLLKISFRLIILKVFSNILERRGTKKVSTSVK